MMRRLVTAALLTGFWIALWERLSWANLLGGIAVAALALYLVPVSPASRELTLRPLAAARLAVYFGWKLIEASAVVTWEVVTPRNRINEAIVSVPMRSSNRFIMTTVANAVSLTPGTVTLEARPDPPVLYIHVLHLKSVEAVRQDVHRLEDLAIRSFVLSVPPPASKPIGPTGGVAP